LGGEFRFRLDCGFDSVVFAVVAVSGDSCGVDILGVQGASERKGVNCHRQDCHWFPLLRAGWMLDFHVAIIDASLASWGRTVVWT